MTEINEPITFTTLLRQCDRIEIPRIQRDYAQGRESEKEVRDDFLRALYDALAAPADGKTKPLNLDFVYGSIENSVQRKRFLPLDGQQRLTTLFLLHWYLSWHDGKLADFKAVVLDDGRSRFTYSVRPSSVEFFDALTNFTPDCTPENLPSIKDLLEDQPWFFLHWRLDPTIQSVLVMMDAIHGLFAKGPPLFSRLTDDKLPAITFHLLPLEHFGLADDLYIKMNARGKPLTPFETFKARFEDLLKELFPKEKRTLRGKDVEIAQFFESRMDTTWTDFFWANKKSKTYTFDDAAMKLLLAVARVSLNPTNEKFSEHTKQLREREIDGSFSAFHERGWLTREFALHLMCLLEAWSSGGGKLHPVLPNTRYFNEVVFFEKVIEGSSPLEYTELIRFAALVLYLRQHEGAVKPEAANEWMRIVFNLSANTDIDRPEEYGRSLIGLQKLLPQSGNILDHFATELVEQIGFSPVQIREEELKAKLLLANTNWKERIDDAEAHEYFSGQIEFLLDFCDARAKAVEAEPSSWEKTVHEQIQRAFDAYLAKAKIMFVRTGLAPLKATGTTYLWKRTLLVVADYLVQMGSNRSFLTDPVRNGDSWKRFLRGTGTNNRANLKALWDQLDSSKPIEPQLIQIMENAKDLEAWREVIVRNSKMIEYCEFQEIRFPAGADEIYLLRKRQMNGAHAELFSYDLYFGLKEIEARLFPLTVGGYEFVALTEEEPKTVLYFVRAKKHIRLLIESANGSFLVYTHKGALVGLQEVQTVLMEQMAFTDQNGFLSRIVARDQMYEVLEKLSRHLGALPPPSPA